MKLIDFFESDASDEAKEKNLVYKGFGRWSDDSGKIIAKTVDGKLQYLDAPENDETSMEHAAHEFALAAHGDQKYGNEPYDNHLEEVVGLAKRFGGDETEITAARLHDVIEDTAVTKEQLAAQFGSEVAEIVDLLSNLGKDYNSKKATFERIRTNPKAVFVKLCDRIANTSRGKKNDKYRKEQPLFKQILYRPGEYDLMWAVLDKILG